MFSETAPITLARVTTYKEKVKLLKKVYVSLQF